MPWVATPTPAAFLHCVGSVVPAPHYPPHPKITKMHYKPSALPLGLNVQKVRFGGVQ